MLVFGKILIGHLSHIFQRLAVTGWYTRPRLGHAPISLCELMHTGTPEPTRLKLRYSAVVTIWTGSGKLCTKVMNVFGSNFAEENNNILYVDNHFV